MLPRSRFSHVQNFTGTTLFFLGVSKLEHLFVINSEHLVPVLVHILSNYNFESQHNDYHRLCGKLSYNQVR